MPYLGLCLGMQVAVIEFARDVLGWADANSGEFDADSSHKVIDFMPGQSDEMDKGGTLRLGAWPCVIEPGARRGCYGAGEISERHRHRYELNNEFRDELGAAGLTVSGSSPDGRLAEAVEITGHPFYVGVQYHPEFKSRPNEAASAVPRFPARGAGARQSRKEYSHVRYSRLHRRCRRPRRCCSTGSGGLSTAAMTARAWPYTTARG